MREEFRVWFLRNVIKLVLLSYETAINSIFFSLLVQRKGRKERTPRKSLYPRSLTVFREFQNSPACGGLTHPAILFLKTAAHSGLFRGYYRDRIFTTQWFNQHRPLLHNALRGDDCERPETQQTYSVLCVSVSGWTEQDKALCRAERLFLFPYFLWAWQRKYGRVLWTRNKI